jgi:hypothetical protein
MATKAKISNPIKKFWLRKRNNRIRKAVKQPSVNYSLSKKFSESLAPIQIPGFTIMPFRSRTESPIALSIFRGSGAFGKPFFQAKYRIMGLHQEPGDRFFGKRYDVLREQNLKRLFPKGRTEGAICYVVALQGARKTRKANQEFKEKTGEYPANFLVKQLLEHAKQMELRGIAVLMPEKNPWVTAHHPKEERQKMEKLYYAAIRKLGFKTIEHSHYLWLIFDK